MIVHCALDCSLWFFTLLHLLKHHQLCELLHILFIFPLFFINFIYLCNQRLFSADLEFSKSAMVF